MTNDETETTDTTLTVRRAFDAPREQVWEVLTDPEQLDQWWGPDGFTTSTDAMEVRPGGEWRFVMTGPDGEEYPNLVVYDEIETPERLAYKHGSPDEPEQFRVTIALDDAGEGETELTMEMRFPSAAALDEAMEFGADDGAKQSLEGLAQHLSHHDAATGGER